MATYSKYQNTDYDSIVSTILLPADAATQSYVFTENELITNLPDNTQKLVTPKSIRNTIVSLYENTIFSQTSANFTEYIGLGKNELDYKLPFYLGNRLYKGQDVLSSMVTGADIMLNNTSTDNSPYLNSTIVSFLAGTNPSIFRNAPKIESRIVINNDDSERLDMSFVNNNGDVSLLSKLSGVNDPGGPVFINGIRYPAIQDSDESYGMGGSASEEKTLIYNNGSVYWGDTIPEDPGYYGMTATTVPIYGKETYVNGYSLDFTDTRNVPIELGEISLGESFDMKSLSSMLERIIYDYLPPTCTLSLSDPKNRYVEIGDLVDIQLSYTITKKTYDTKPTALKNMIPNQVPEILSPINKTITGNAKGIIILPVEKNTTTFEIFVSDGLETRSASASVTGIYPFYYGLTSSGTNIDTSTLLGFSKNVEPKKTIKVDLYRSGLTVNDNLYFMYDADYGDLTSVIDPFGNDVVGNFDVQSIVVSSPNGFWFSKYFRVYKLSNFYSTYINPNTLSCVFSFIF